MKFILVTNVDNGKKLLFSTTSKSAEVVIDLALRRELILDIEEVELYHDPVPRKETNVEQALGISREIQCQS